MSSLQNFSQIAAGFFPNCSPVCSWRILVLGCSVS
ncbi:hypothetical protein SLEP1_g42304 [Rubroshorea leprosula]|uniref:Uncharacterized protein n=1 Tax=Rubroshorea leprosula TaxID=152421 RepID=A0AAV5L9W9_9ROSI|nr:hypothetical protein SLEP1_g42304 [Rubroshorea leprosula]